MTWCGAGRGGIISARERREEFRRCNRKSRGWSPEESPTKSGQAHVSRGYTSAVSAPIKSTRSRR